MSLIRIFQEAGWDVHFASSANEGKPSEKLRAMGIPTRTIAPNDPAFDPWIAELAPDVVIFERFMMEEQYGWRVSENSPESIRVLDTVDLHFVRRARQTAIQDAQPLDLHGVDALREVASIYRSDCSLLISDFEMKLLSDQSGAFRVPAELLHEFGFCYDPPPPPTDDSVRNGFVVIGNFRHEPNADGVRWLQREIWPEIRRRLPLAQVRVYGAYPPREIMNLHDPATGFLVLGPAPDQYEALSRHLVNLAPLRFGAGLKGKISDGWWCGTPCVTTLVGAEGMRSAGRFGGIVAEDAAAFAEAACLLHENALERERARQDGYNILRERFDHRRNGASLLGILQDLRETLESRRLANFTGRMLTHHQHQSTKYFSRWIELKNRVVR